MQCAHGLFECMYLNKDLTASGCSVDRNVEYISRIKVMHIHVYCLWIVKLHTGTYRVFRDVYPSDDFE